MNFCELTWVLTSHSYPHGYALFITHLRQQTDRESLRTCKFVSQEQLAHATFIVERFKFPVQSPPENPNFLA